MSNQKLCDACGFALTSDDKYIQHWGCLITYGKKSEKSDDPLGRMFYGDSRNNKHQDLCPRCVQQVESLLAVFEAVFEKSET